jgi:Tfp pilus assembly protein PilX
MKRNNQRGSALIFALILLLVLSAMAGSLTFLSNSETYSSMNYRMMTQARYGAEAGVNAAANFLMSNNYVPPAGIGPYPSCNFVGYNACVYPVTDAAGAPVYLSTLSTQAPNYPGGQMQTAFANAMNGPQPLQAGVNSINYSASAQLMSMISIVPFGTTTPVTVQTWQITAHGDIANVQNGEAEVQTTLERYISPAFSYAAFADSNGCAALSFTGNGTTDSYDSGAVTAGTAPTAFNSFGGNVGTNGNETDSGANPTINGTLSVPNATTGVCGAGNVTGFTGNLNQVTGGMVQLPQPVVLPPPSFPVPLAGTPNTIPGCAVNPCDISLSGTTTLTLTPGTYTINSLQMAGQSTIAIAPDPVTGQYGPVILNVVNSTTAGNGSNTPITIAGNGISNPSYDPSLFQIICCAPNTPINPTIKIAGNGASAAVVYAPSATADLKGNAQFFGSIIANQLLDVGNGAIHYDMRLKREAYTIGNYVLQAFTWNKY